MRLLLGENLPKRLKADFPEHEIYTVRDKAWNGIKNGPLLEFMLEKWFSCFTDLRQKPSTSAELSEIHYSCFHSFGIKQTYLELTKLSTIVHQYLKQESLPIGPIIVRHNKLVTDHE
jgi:hypothetical protein